MPTLDSIRKRASGGDFYGVLLFRFTLYDTGRELIIRITERGLSEYNWHGSIVEDRAVLHEATGELEYVITNLEQYLNREGMIPKEPEFLTDHDILTVMQREFVKLERMLSQIEDNQVLLRRCQIEYLSRHQEVLGPKSAFQRLENSLEED